jgi:hypothetical protein
LTATSHHRYFESAACLFGWRRIGARPNEIAKTIWDKSRKTVVAAYQYRPDDFERRRLWSNAITLPKRIQPVEELAPPVLQEKFDNPSGSLVKWPQSGKCHMSKGKLYIAEERIVPVGAFTYDDFEATATATIIIPPQRSAGGGSASTSDPLNSPISISLPAIGLQFRINENGYYRLLLSPASGGSGGLYKLQKVANGKQTEITSWRRDAAIAMRNQIKLRCAGSKMEIYVNNLRLDTLKDDSHMRGSISLIFSG